MDVNTSAAVVGIAAAAGVKAVTTAISAVYWILPIIGLWILFECKGSDGWRAIIPIYRDYMSYKLFYNTKKFWILFVSTIVCVLSVLFLFIGIAAENIPIIAVSMILFFVTLIIVIVVSIQYDIALCKRYGQGVLFTVCMVFFSPVFICILAYLVKTGKAKEVTSDTKEVSEKAHEV